MQTPLNGITSSIPNAVCPDGDSHLLVNLRQKQQTLQPVTTGKNIGTLTTDYDFIYLHQFNANVNWLGVINNTLYDNLLRLPRFIVTIDAPISRLQNIGNILIAVTETGLYYLLHKDNRYIPLGYKPPFPYFTYAIYTNVASTRFSELSAIPDLQAAMEALLIKNRWKPDNAYKLCGTYLIRYALRLYDGTYICHSSPVLVGEETEKHPYRVILKYLHDSLQTTMSIVQAALYQVKCTFSLSSLSPWRDIVSSVDIFISNELGMISENFKSIENSITSVTEPGDRLQPYLIKQLQPQDIDKEKIYANITDVSNFYLIKSIPISEAEAQITFPEKSDLTTMQNIVYNQQLPVDPFSHHNITAGYTYVYNQRLHLANVQTIFFAGFNLKAFIAQQHTITTASAGITTRTGSSTTRPNTQPQPEKKSIQRAYIQTYIKLPGDTTACVTSEAADLHYYYFEPFYSYPDPRAYKAVIYLCDSGNIAYKKLELTLKPHPTLNMAYYINPDLSPLTPVDIPPTNYSYQKQIVSVNEDNKIKVSALTNPFVFPNENTYTTNGQVIAIASNAVTVSEGQFGQYPLYLFTQNGIYVMQSPSDGTIAYSNIVPVGDEIALPDTIIPVTGAVFFLTARGAYIISGSTTLCISAMLDAQPAEPYCLQNFDAIADYLFPGFPVKNPSFRDFILTPGISIHFNYRQNEILLMNAQLGYAYVYNFNSRQWHITTHVFAPVRNTFPSLYGIQQRNILDISDETDTPTPVCLLTRPLKFGSQQFKNLHRQFLRSRLALPADAGLFSLASNDAVHFRIKSNKRIPPGVHIDVDTGLIARNQYRYFATLFIGTLCQNSHIDHLDSTAYAVYNNDKIR